MHCTSVIRTVFLVLVFQLKNMMLLWHLLRSNVLCDPVRFIDINGVLQLYCINDIGISAMKANYSGPIPGTATAAAAAAAAAAVAVVVVVVVVAVVVAAAVAAAALMHHARYRGRVVFSIVSRRVLAYGYHVGIGVYGLVYSAVSNENWRMS
jgi:hypothetical protein